MKHLVGFTIEVNRPYQSNSHTYKICGVLHLHTHTWALYHSSRKAIQLSHVFKIPYVTTRFKSAVSRENNLQDSSTGY